MVCYFRRYGHSTTSSGPRADFLTQRGQKIIRVIKDLATDGHPGYVFLIWSQVGRIPGGPFVGRVTFWGSLRSTRADSVPVQVGLLSALLSGRCGTLMRTLKAPHERKVGRRFLMQRNHTCLDPVRHALSDAVLAVHLVFGIAVRVGRVATSVHAL